MVAEIEMQHEENLFAANNLSLYYFQIQNIPVKRQLKILNYCKIFFKVKFLVRNLI